MVGNVIVGQSGGPTAVINSSLAGVFKSMLIYLKKSRLILTLTY